MIDYNSEDIQTYCKSHTDPNNTLLSKLEKYTWENEEVPQMISGQMVGKFLQSIILMINAKRIIEVGTFTGYSALQMAEALPSSGEIHTCELMEKHAKTAQSFFNKSEHGKKITIYQGPGISSLESLKIGSFDMAFIDADKSNYMEYYKRCLALIRKGGIIILDNMLWSGTVINPNDDDSKSLRKTGDYIQKDVRVFNILVPIRDGLMLCIKNEK
jgi:caffeoyl-CoA O-methyltransferase